MLFIFRHTLKIFFSVPATVEKGASVKLDKDAKIVKTALLSRSSRNGVTIEIEKKWRLYYLKNSPVARDSLYQGGGKGLETQLHILESGSFVI